MMRFRAAAVLTVVGTTMFGIATGLVFVDVRLARLPAPDDPAPSLPDPSLARVVAAMALGPLGAGLALVGVGGMALCVARARRQSGQDR
ncbi:MAG: hypothetical protein LW650_02275 [Planctomycetaceae bacterium]|jgi:hypothetical protein|nr:hypothetical protein [Phycisphaerales bacterium]MCE2652352.1 hypothetical protein [Planctomycetaceae bacterium]